MTISLEEHVARAIKPLRVVSRRKHGLMRDDEYFIVDDASDVGLAGGEFTAGPFSSFNVACEQAKLINARAAIAAVREREGARLDLHIAAARYMASVRALGQQSGFNGLTFFQAPILDPMPKDLGMEAVRRWQELDGAGKALAAALATLPPSDPAEAKCAKCKQMQGILQEIDETLDGDDWGPRSELRIRIAAALKGNGEGR